MKISALPSLPLGGFISGKIPVFYSGGRYQASPSDIAGGLTAAVSPQQFGGDPTGAAAADAAVAAAFATGRPVSIDGWYRLTATLTTPAYSVCSLKNYDCGFIADMATGPAIQFGAQSLVPSLRVKSVAYAVATLADTASWSLGNRRILPGSGCRFGNVWLSDLADGIDCDTVSDVRIENLYCRNIRSREGWAAAFHTRLATDCYVGYLDAKNCDRAAEVEYASKRCGVMRLRAESIYPAGYVGQPGTYAAYSFVMSSHSHSGEGGCRDIVYGDAWISDCMGAVNIQ